MDTARLISTAEEAAKAAGKRLVEGAETLRKVTFEDRTDVKLQADTESETFIRNLFAEQTPDIPVIGEEEGGDSSLTGQDRLYWVVDPLDGTFNYLRGMSQCAVSIGLMRGETPVLGVIHDFNRNLCYSGAPGTGFFLNGEATHFGWAKTRAQAALATGLPNGMDRAEANMVAFVRLMAPYKKVRMVGSAALALAYVASGQLDVYHEEAIRLWDVAAGIALVQAAGGVIRMTPSPTGKFLAYDVWAAGRLAFLPESLQ